MVVYVVAAIADILLACFILAHDKGRATVSFAMLSVCVGIWSLELFFLASVTDLATLEPLFQITRIGMFFIGPSLFLFVATVTRTQLGGLLKSSLIVTFAFAIVTSLLSLFVMPSSLHAVQGGYSPEFDSISKAFYINLAFCSVMSIVVSQRAYRQAIFRERQRILWIAFGVALGILFGWAHVIWPKYYIGTLASILCIYLISYAVVRYRTISVRFAVQEGGIKVAAALPLVFGFGLFDYICGQLGLKKEGYIIAQVIVLVALLQAYPWLNRKLGELRDHYFFQSSYNYDFTRNWLSKGLQGSASAVAFETLCNEVFLRLVRVEGFQLHLSIRHFVGRHSASEQEADGFILFDLTQGSFGETSPLRGAFLDELLVQQEVQFYDEAAPAFKDAFASLRISAVVPVKLDGTTVGFVTLGAPQKKEQFSYDDIRLLNWFGGELGPALEHLIAFTHLETSLDDAEKTLSVVARLNEYNHDVKTPFSNIEALLLAGDAFTAEERQARILDQVRKGHALVATMTRLLRGRHHKARTRFDLNGLVRDVVQSFPTHAPFVFTRLEDDLPLLTGYEEEIGILLSNLLSNAFGALDKLSPEVTVETSYDSAADCITCTIRDNGRGMSDDRLKTLWSKPTTGRRANGGTGLGLMVVKRITESHGGEVTVTSQPGKGTSFTLTFPTSETARASSHDNVTPLRVKAAQPR